MSNKYLNFCMRDPKKAAKLIADLEDENTTLMDQCKEYHKKWTLAFRKNTILLEKIAALEAQLVEKDARIVELRKVADRVSRFGTLVREQIVFQAFESLEKERDDALARVREYEGFNPGDLNNVTLEDLIVFEDVAYRVAKPVLEMIRRLYKQTGEG